MVLDSHPYQVGWLQVYKRLQEIDADGAEARAAIILAGLSFDSSMQVCCLTQYSLHV